MSVQHSPSVSRPRGAILRAIAQLTVAPIMADVGK